MIGVFSALLLALSVHPWPVGPGPRYQPPAAAKPAPGLACGPRAPSFRVHLELFAGRKVVIVPAGIGAVGALGLRLSLEHRRRRTASSASRAAAR